MNPKKAVLELDPYVPGRSKEEIVNEFNINEKDIIKLGSNENPWGPSSKVKTAILNEVDNVNRYPESDLTKLESEIANYAGVKPNQVIIGGDGADEVLDSLIKTFIEPGDEFIVPLPSYTYYEFLLKPYGAIPIYGNWDLNSNTLDVDSILNSLSDKTKMIFLCSPNNPTGAVINEEDIKTILDATNALVIIDEAYIEYAESNHVNLIKDYSNVFILRTFSKVMGLAGMRIGYGLSNSENIEYMHRIKPVFSLTRLSYVAALATLKDKKFIEDSIIKGKESRDLLYEGVSKINKLHVLKSQSNFMVIDVRETGFTANELSYELLKKGVIVRDCTSFKGLDEYWIRISIATIEEDKKFLNILKEVVN
ncbi:MAG: histidinol-phosphate transaminase [Methanobacteriaceae archaeon]|jgi:histidinol-phosphate aminotransferase|uniref:histidinol-phosphate transaminase n=1 Tax=Methanobrevibacter TaxID=2172 RepID=UPI002A149BBD|nr:histidinol-phosphate transaminase [Methanobacteriaceae archaeon]MDD3408246.1 histidinol-phosphate transaminase [Methanobacteriaceae archaeon]MDD4593750.1 histidinol-phosphate transaminase [Methanobacteriaceae archaeon]